MKFTILQQEPNSKARYGKLDLFHGTVETPEFMPIATQASIRTLSKQEILDCGAQIILSNTYHLYLRPGIQILQESGGLHGFMNWQKPILTDSGGFQVVSMAPLKKVKPEGVYFRSHIDGSSHLLTPEKVIDIQIIIGSDVMMALDVPCPYPTPEIEVAKNDQITYQYEKRLLEYYHQLCNDNPDLAIKHTPFGIVQGGTFGYLREISAQKISSLNFPGYAIGGLAGGEPAVVMMEMVSISIANIPEEKIHYLMGLGYPNDIVRAVDLGCDLFDCVIPTRNGRKGMAFTDDGPILIRHARHKYIYNSPIEEGCDCYACRTYSRAYLRHLLIAEEQLAGRMVSLHNIHYYMRLTRNIRTAIKENRFVEFKRDFFNRYGEFHHVK
jgi:queuine tRNA-ribosyltransferase